MGPSLFDKYDGLHGGGGYDMHSRGGKTNPRRRPKTHAERREIKPLSIRN